MARKCSIHNKQELIIKAAGKLFCHYGYEKTTLDDIARSAGIGKGTVYVEFKSKQDIMAAVIMQFVNNLNIKMREIADNAEENILCTVKELYIQRILMHYYHAKNYFHGAELFTFPFSEIEERDKIYYEIDAIIAQLLQKAATKGEIAEFDDYLKISGCIRKALIFLHPPMVMEIDNVDEIKKEANDILDIILAGLTVKKQS